MNEFRREHTLDAVGGPTRATTPTTARRARRTRSRSSATTPARWHLYSDAQLRTANFHYHGDVAIAPIRWTFFNPKLGARYDLVSTAGVYGSAGLSTREPARNDLFQGEDNASFAHDLHAVRPERAARFRSGLGLIADRCTVSANVYAMEFRHEIASTGELSDIGLLLRRNVDRSYRRGIELEYAWQATPHCVCAATRTSAAIASTHGRSSTTSTTPPATSPAASRSRFTTSIPLLTPPMIVNQSSTTRDRRR